MDDSCDFEMSELLPMVDEILGNHPDDTRMDKRNKKILAEYYLKQRSMPEIGRRRNMTRQGVCEAIKRGLFLLRMRFNDLAKECNQ